VIALFGSAIPTCLDDFGVINAKLNGLGEMAVILRVFAKKKTAYPGPLAAFC